MHCPFIMEGTVCDLCVCVHLPPLSVWSLQSSLVGSEHTCPETSAEGAGGPGQLCQFRAAPQVSECWCAFVCQYHCSPTRPRSISVYRNVSGHCSRVLRVCTHVQYCAEVLGHLGTLLFKAVYLRSKC